MNARRQCILLVDDDAQITDAMSMVLERPGRTVVVCSDVDSAEVALLHFPVTHLVSDVQFSGEFGFEGLHYLARVRTQAPDCRIFLMTGRFSSALRAEALQHGATEVLAKPFAIDELERLLAEDDAELHTEPYDVIRIPPMAEILHGDTLSVVFQPIVRLAPQSVTAYGFEALTRVRGRWLAGGPPMLFDYASRRQKLAELNILAMTGAIAAAAELPDESALFVNIDPLTFERPQLVTALQTAARRAAISLDRVVLEVTERSGFCDAVAASSAFDELRDLGIRFALDDHGSAYSHLSLINRIRPSFVKLSQSFGTGFEEDDTKERIVRHTISLASDFGCETVLEGIENAATAHAAAEAGVALGQGFHFGRPRSASRWVGIRSAQAA